MRGVVMALAALAATLIAKADEVTPPDSGDDVAAVRIRTGCC